MRTPCCRSFRSNRLVVSEYKVPKVWFPKSAKFFLDHPVCEKDLNSNQDCLIEGSERYWIVAILTYCLCR